jgi:hypothetical protein
LPKDPGNMSIQTIVLKYYNIPVQIEWYVSSFSE